MEVVKTLLVIICLLMLGAYSVFGQEYMETTLTPTLIESEANPGETQTHILTITNASEEEKEYRVSTKVVEGVEKESIPRFAEDSEKHEDEITDWIKVPTDPIQVAAGSSTNFTITLAIPHAATPGGYFGGVLITPNATLSSTTAPEYEIASLINLKVKGDVLYDARIRSFSTDRLLYNKKDVVFTIEIENQGNVLIRPTGPITISNIFGTEPEIFIVNEARAGIFPGTSRSIDFHWTSHGFEFGKHEAVVALVYETPEGQKTIDATLIFWVFPIQLIVLLTVLILGIIVTGYILTHYYLNQTNIRNFGERRIAPSTHRKRVGMSKSSFMSLIFISILIILIFLMFIFKA